MDDLLQAGAMLWARPRLYGLGIRSPVSPHSQLVNAPEGRDVLRAWKACPNPAPSPTTRSHESDVGELTAERRGSTE